jgi:hypothetical protein
MKKILFVLLIAICLISCSGPRYGCDYKGGHVPKFRADIQVQGRLDSVLYHVPGRAVLKMYVAKLNKPVYVYYGYFRGFKKQYFEAGSKWTLQFDSNDTGKIKKSIVKLNS